jgi:acyl transferase domain-containing protein
VKCSRSTAATNIRTSSISAAKGTRLFLEISPEPCLCDALRAATADTRIECQVIGCELSQARADQQLLAALGQAYVAGHRVNWQVVAPRGECVQLPRYPWQRKRYWLTRPTANNTRPENAAARGVDEDMRRAE